MKNFAVSFYLSDSVESHFEKILEKVEAITRTYHLSGDFITEKSWGRLLLVGHEHNQNKILKKIAINIYTKSASFNSADNFFDVFIEPIMSQFDGNEVVELIQGVENNSQANGRRQAKLDHQRLMDVCEKSLPHGFDESEFPNFFSYKKAEKRPLAEEATEVTDW